MRVVNLVGTYKGEVLYDELFAACPWLDPSALDLFANKAYVELVAGGCNVWYDERYAPVDAETQIQAVAQAHNSESLTVQEQEQLEFSNRVVQIKNYLNGITGLNFADMTVTDRWKLLAIILMRFRVLDKDGVVQSYEDWRF